MSEGKIVCKNYKGVSNNLNVVLNDSGAEDSLIKFNPKLHTFVDWIDGTSR